MTNSGPSVSRLIRFPLYISIAIILFRLIGELLNWWPWLFNREAGGGGSPLGITWLAPVFGIYFGWRLAQAGEAPPNKWKAIGLGAIGLAIILVGFPLVVNLQLGIYQRLLIFWVCAMVAAALQYPAWPRLFKTLLAYGVAARLFVAIVMLVTMIGDWKTHYDAPPPGLPEMGVFAKWLLIGLAPQLLLWTSFTNVTGGLFGSIAAAFARKDEAARAAQV